ncbi:MAG: hypothetical protein IJO49_01005, partial [Clostridia bacterium]|nr:hypothetical protein [Clostridia bacterium]
FTNHLANRGIRWHRWVLFRYVQILPWQINKILVIILPLFNKLLKNIKLRLFEVLALTVLPP